MKLSTRGRYASRLMLELAINFENGPIFLKDIARDEEISEKYLGQLIAPLKTAKLINSTRGAHGGYSLARAPEEIRLSEVVRAAEGPLVLVECVENPDVCNRICKCVTRDIWEEVSIKIQETLDQITLADMLERNKEKQSGSYVNNYII